ncbi:15815_t:CDS:2 [Entrophospora sp. SA101]|nr:15814_t:CDS:2 [Entrophospora sp. SA101]CAJ0848096.1 15815_t:CDS:2 [Entrophospora sp. SA101]
MGFGCGFPVIVELEVDDEGGVETVGKECLVAEFGKEVVCTYKLFEEIAVEFEEFELFKNGLIILI